MAFEFFEEDGRGFEPKASIRKQGQIGLNQGAIKRYSFENNQFVLLAYDKVNNVIGIKKVVESAKGAKRVVIRNNNCSIAAKAFFDYFEIPYKDTDSFDMFEDKENKIICFKIAKNEEFQQT